LKLFCVPHAGSSALNYYKWSTYLPKTIKVIPLELAGRGQKSSKDLYDTFEEAVDDLALDLKSNIEDEDYALFGHSLGCWLVYELYFKLKEMGLRMPSHLFLSGRFSPLTDRAHTKISELDDDEFLEHVKQIGGLTDDLLLNPKLLAIYMKIFRSDFKIIESYEPKQTELIQCDCTVLSGTNDTSISNKELLLWNQLTAQGCMICKIKGGHFFPFDNAQDTTQVIVEKLSMM